MQVWKRLRYSSRSDLQIGLQAPVSLSYIVTHLALSCQVLWIQKPALRELLSQWEMASRVPTQLSSQLTSL